MKRAKKSAAPKVAPAYSVSHCNIHMDAFVPTPELISAVKSIAEAAFANAKAIEMCANRLCGPDDSRMGMRIGP